MKKILATILALVLAIGVTTMAWATETAAEKVAKVGETEYATLQEAVNAADGKTVQLLQDVTASITIESGKTVTLDLNGKTLTNEDEALLDDLHETARRLDDRLMTIERIVAADRLTTRN